ncbi:MAG: isocitrate/isopropylmalate dehydrogenase family protein [Thermoplasmatota archaeon]
MKRVCVIGGDGIGPEVIAEARQCVDAVGVKIEWIEAEAGLACRGRTGSYLPQATREAVQRADAVLFGAITSPLASEDPNYKSVVLELRAMLDAYANIRPARNWGQPRLVPNLDVIVVRENSEGEYNAPESVDAEGVTTMRRISRLGSERVARFGFDWAARHGRRQVTCVHKANVIRLADGLFRDEFRMVAKDFPALVTTEALVDSCAHDLARDPKKFDVIVTMNLYGDILSDLAAGLTGGLGFAPSGNYGARKALFEPVHGSAPNLAGRDVANPSAAILSAAMMLEYLGSPAEAQRLDAAVRRAIGEGRTVDAGGSLGTQAFGALVRRSLVRV